MAVSNLKNFLIALSESTSLQSSFKTDSETVLVDHGLSDEEKKLVQGNDLDAIRKYLGDEGTGVQIRVNYD